VSDRRAYQREYQRNYRMKKIDRIIFHLGGKCAACGSDEGLEIHHKDPKTKSFNPGSKGYAWSAIVEELKKCELRCRDCHQDAHGRSKHGTKRRYQIYHCRCTICVDAVKAMRRKHQGTEEYKAWARDYKRNKYQNDPKYRARFREQQNAYRRSKANVACE
jgi:hypothetical protein